MPASDTRPCGLSSIPWIPTTRSTSCLGFFGFLRAGEFMVNSTFDPSIHLTVQDLQVDVEVNPSSSCMCIKSSKNDLFPQGCFIYLGRALSNFGHSGIFTSLRALIWSPIHRHPWSAFNSFSSVFLHPVCVTGGGNPWQFSSHSFRIGAATAAAQSGIPDHLIKTLGGWTSDAY